MEARMKPKVIVIDGKTYNRIEDMPPDIRQKYASSWPESIDDSIARKDWHWSHTYNLSDIVEDMLWHIK